LKGASRKNERRRRRRRERPNKIGIGGQAASLRLEGVGEHQCMSKRSYPSGHCLKKGKFGQREQTSGSYAVQNGRVQAP